MENNRVIKVFISIPMSGRSDEEVEKERADILKDLVNKLDDSIEEIDSFFKGAPYEANPAWFMGKSIQLLSNADVVVFAPGWENSRGCKIEHTVAKEFGYDIIEL